MQRSAVSEDSRASRRGKRSWQNVRRIPRSTGFATFMLHLPILSNCCILFFLDVSKISSLEQQPTCLAGAESYASQCEARREFSRKVRDDFIGRNTRANMAELDCLRKTGFDEGKILFSPVLGDWL